MKYTLKVDHQHCWGCKTCEVACKQENRTADGVKLVYVTEDGPKIANGKLDFVYKVNLCTHCNDPLCATACPVEAIAKRPDGIVVLDEEVCTGCRSCLSSCPYGAIAYDDAKGKAQKCNMCYHRIDHGLLPACADNICLAHCIYFGEAEQAEKMAQEKSWLKYRLAGRLGDAVIKVINKSS